MTMDRQYLALVFACLVLLTASAPSKPATYDGQWWLSINQRQRGGFQQGFVVCYSHFVNRKLFYESGRAYNMRLTEYLQGHPESLSEPVEATLLKIASPPYAKSIHRLPPNETPTELAAKWGAHNDGDEWRGADPWWLGYIQGFLECYSRHGKSKYGTFSKSPEWYVDAISNWYGTRADDEGAINESRAQEKIPEVLFRFRDKPEDK
jgi:hypothetical protein